MKHHCGSVCACVAAEIPGFLSDEECGVVVRLAQLKGLMESQVMVPEGQEELNQQLNLSPEEIFNFLDLNQDGQLQPHEVCRALVLRFVNVMCGYVTCVSLFMFVHLHYV